MTGQSSFVFSRLSFSKAQKYVFSPNECLPGDLKFLRSGKIIGKTSAYATSSFHEGIIGPDFALVVAAIHEMIACRNN